MVVSKIECVPGNSGYDLTVSREYHEHDRTWRQAGSTDCACVEKYAGAYKCPTLVPVSSGTGASGQFRIDAGGTGHFRNNHYLWIAVFFINIKIGSLPSVTSAICYWI